MKDNDSCPCGLNADYSSCCKPLLDGEKSAETAERLMRSRYTAYVVKDVDYLMKTWHFAGRPKEIETVSIPDWIGLEIVRTEEGLAGDAEGIVEFKAQARNKQHSWQLHEVSRFVRDDDKWYYVDGDVVNPQPVTSNKVGRNAPCPCGSGKKFKKCCGP
jgi:SEC-C motif domain protein